MRTYLVLMVIALAATACGCDRNRVRKELDSKLCDASTGLHAEIDRFETRNQCLAREFTLEGRPFVLEIPVPEQQNREVYATKCDVELSPIGAAGKCTHRLKLAGLKMKIEYDFGSEKYKLTLKRKNGSKLLDAVTPTFRQGPVPYLEYWDEGERLTYFVYLADFDRGSARQAKFYWVEVFDDRDAKECQAELPKFALKPKDVCNLQVPRVTTFNPFGRIGTRQTDTGGGYEPPK